MAAIAPSSTTWTNAQGSLARDLADVRQALCELVTRSLGEIEVSHAAPQASMAGRRGINLYLLAFAPATATASARQNQGLQFTAHFLVTVWAPDEVAAGDDLAELMFAALGESDIEVDQEPLPASTWAAFGLVPRPSFMVKATVRRARAPRQRAPAVREAVLRLSAALLPLRGGLFAPDETPIAGARVEITEMGLATLTDHLGRFAFSAVPGGRPLRLKALARGASASFDLQIPENDVPFVSLHMSLSQPQL